MEPRMVCWRQSSSTSFLWRRGDLSLQLLSQVGGAQLFQLLRHQQWLCGSVTCPRSGRLGQPQSKVVEDGGEKRRISQQGGALGEGGEGTLAQEDPPNSLKGEEDTNIVLGRRNPWWGGGRSSSGIEGQLEPVLGGVHPSSAVEPP